MSVSLFAKPKTVMLPELNPETFSAQNFAKASHTQRLYSTGRVYRLFRFETDRVPKDSN